MTTATEPGRIVLRVDADGMHGLHMPSTATITQAFYHMLPLAGHEAPAGATVTLTGPQDDLVRFDLANGTWVYRLIEYDGLTDEWLIRWVD